MSHKRSPERRGAGATTTVREAEPPKAISPGAGRLAVTKLLVVGAFACVQPGDHAHMPGDRTGRHAPGIIGRESGVARAAVPHMQGARTRVSLVLAQPADWDGTAVVTGPRRGTPLIDTRDPEHPVSPGAIQAIRDAVVATLVLPRGTTIPIQVELGRQGGAPDLWNLQVSTSGLLQTFGAERPLSPSQTRQYLRYGEDPQLADGANNLVFGPQQWIEGALRPAVVGEVKNSSGMREHIHVEATPPCRLLVEGELVDTDQVELPPKASFGVVSHAEDESQGEARIQVDRYPLP